MLELKRNDPVFQGLLELRKKIDLNKELKGKFFSRQVDELIV